MNQAAVNAQYRYTKTQIEKNANVISAEKNVVAMYERLIKQQERQGAPEGELKKFMEEQARREKELKDKISGLETQARNLAGKVASRGTPEMKTNVKVVVNRVQDVKKNETKENIKTRKYREFQSLLKSKSSFFGGRKESPFTEENIEALEEEFNSINADYKYDKLFRKIREAKRRGGTRRPSGRGSKPNRGEPKPNREANKKEPNQGSNKPNQEANREEPNQGPNRPNREESKPNQEANREEPNQGPRPNKENQKRSWFGFGGNTKEKKEAPPDKNLQEAMNLFNLKNGFTKADVDRKYRRLALQYHPNKAATGNEEKFKKLDPLRQRLYKKLGIQSNNTERQQKEANAVAAKVEKERKAEAAKAEKERKAEAAKVEKERKAEAAKAKREANAVAVRNAMNKAVKKERNQFVEMVEKDTTLSRVNKQKILNIQSTNKAKVAFKGEKSRVQKEKKALLKALETVNSTSRELVFSKNQKSNIITRFNLASNKSWIKKEVDEAINAKRTVIKGIRANTDTYEKLLTTTYNLNGSPIYDPAKRKQMLTNLRVTNNKSKKLEDLKTEIAQKQRNAFVTAVNKSALTQLAKTGIKGKYSEAKNKQTAVKTFKEIVKNKNGLETRLGTTYDGNKLLTDNVDEMNKLESKATILLENMNTTDAAGANKKMKNLKQILVNASGIAGRRVQPEGKETGISMKFNSIKKLVGKAENVLSKKKNTKNKLTGILKRGVQKAKNEKTVKNLVGGVTNGLIKGELIEEIAKFGVNTKNINKKTVRELKNQLGTLRGEKAGKRAANEVNRQKVVSNLVKKSTNAVIAKGEAEEKNKLIRQITNASYMKINREAYEQKSIQNLKNQLSTLRSQRALKRSQQVNINKEAKSKRDQEERRQLILNIPKLQSLGGGSRTEPDVLEAKNLENLRNMKKKLEEKQVTGKESKAATKLQAAQRGFRERLTIITNLEKNTKNFLTTRPNHIQKKQEITKVLTEYKKPPITSIDMRTVRQFRKDLENMKKVENENKRRLIAEAEKKRNEAERVKKEKKEFNVKYQSLKEKREIIYMNNKVPGMIKFISDILPSEIKTEDNLRRFKYTTVNGKQKILDNTGMNEIKKNIENAKRKAAVTRIQAGARGMAVRKANPKQKAVTTNNIERNILSAELRGNKQLAYLTRLQEYKSGKGNVNIVALKQRAYGNIREKYKRLKRELNALFNKKRQLMNTYTQENFRQRINDAKDSLNFARIKTSLEEIKEDPIKMAVNKKKKILMKLITKKKVTPPKKDAIITRIKGATTAANLNTIAQNIENLQETKSKVNTGRSRLSRVGGQRGRNLMSNEKKSSSKA